MVGQQHNSEHYNPAIFRKYDARRTLTNPRYARRRMRRLTEKKSNKANASDSKVIKNDVSKLTNTSNVSSNVVEEYNVAHSGGDETNITSSVDDYNFTSNKLVETNKSSNVDTIVISGSTDYKNDSSVGHDAHSASSSMYNADSASNKYVKSNKSSNVDSILISDCNDVHNDNAIVVGKWHSDSIGSDIYNIDSNNPVIHNNTIQRKRGFFVKKALQSMFLHYHVSPYV